MSFRTLVTASLLLIATDLVAAGARADFNPFGRKPPKPGSAAPAKPRAPSAAPAPAPAQGAGAAKPSSDALIARYTGIVLQRPGEMFPLERLAELYRERDGSLDKLIADLEGRVAKGGVDSYNALVALAGVFRQDAQHDRAIQTYEKAIAEKPDDATALAALAGLLSDRGDKAGARARYEAALPHIKADATREQTLRTLLSLSLDLNDLDAAKRYHAELVKRAQGSFFARAELGRELLTRGQYAKAEAEFREVLRSATGDNRAMAPALRDLGHALAKQKKSDEALPVLKRALQAAGDQSGLRREVFDIIVEVYRAKDNLPELITLLEQERPNDFERLALLGSLYEETGRVKDALATYKKALGVKQNDISTRLKVVQLLQVQGELDEAIRQYEALIRAAPHSSEFVFQLAEALIQRGDRLGAIEHLKRLEARSAGDEDTMAALVDFYERVDEADRARALLERLAVGRSDDPRHLIELGDRFLQEGNEKRALDVWQRIKLIVPDKAKAQHTLGEVYLEHDMPERALEAFKQAIELAPKEESYKKAYALALERAGSTAPAALRARQYEEARRIWEEILRSASGNPHLAREARQHIVTLWSLSKQLYQRVAPLERRLRSSPPDIEAGRLLAEVYTRLRRYPEAERTLRTIVQQAPGDVGSYLSLERVLASQRKLSDAIVVLQKLVKLEPKRAREYYQRMAHYAAELYRDDDAIKYASKAVELSPEDAEGHKKLGEMYQRRQETKQAIHEYRKAISKNDRLFPVYFQLSELLINQGEVEEADLLLRRVMRASPDEELVAQAARLSMQVNLGRGTLESLEKELLPVALGNPQKPIYRRLLVEIYGNIAFPLVHETKSANAEKARAAREQLRKLGERAVKPLLDALSDERDSQQRISIELLSHIRNKGAGSALFTYATGSADAQLRTRAMIAVGALKDPELLPKLEELLVAGGEPRASEGDTVAVAAAWSVARMQSPRARNALLTLLESDAPSVRALGALGLGLIDSKRDASRLGEVARTAHSGATLRAAAAFALGQLGAREQADALRALAEAPDAIARGSAIVALARLGSEAAPRAIAEALVGADPELRAAGESAALVFVTREYRANGELLEVPEGRIDVAQIVSRLRPTGYEASDRAGALAALGDELARAAAMAVQSSPERARVVSDALLGRAGAPGFLPLTRDLERASAESRKKAEAAATKIASTAVGPFLALIHHPSASVRAVAIQFLATRPEPDAVEAVIRAVRDDDPQVQQAALVAVRHVKDARAIAAVTELLAAAGDWPVRVRAAEALGRMKPTGGVDAASRALALAATRDKYALVREAAIVSLHALDQKGSRTVLGDVASRDAEPRVREVARKLLGK